MSGIRSLRARVGFGSVSKSNVDRGIHRGDVRGVLGGEPRLVIADRADCADSQTTGGFRLPIGGVPLRFPRAAPQSRGLLAIAEGFYLLDLGDHRQLELSLPVYDALYAWCKHEVAAA
ncbi:MAG: hypothetical protein ACXWZ8_03085 [Gaiellaceae bacterium]